MSNLSELLGGGGGAGADFQEFTSSGTWTKPASAQFVRVEVWAAGGGAEGSVTPNPYGFFVSSNGGGGGGYMSRTFNASELGATEPVVVGAGGSGGPAPQGDGTPGGNSSFSTRITTYGGIAGTNPGPGTGGRAWGDANPAVFPAPGVFTYASSMGRIITGGSATTSQVANFYGGGAGGKASGPVYEATGQSSIYGGGGGGAGGDTPTTNRQGGSQTAGQGGGGSVGGGPGPKLGDGGGGAKDTSGGNGNYAGGGGGGAPGGSGGPGIVRVYTW